MIVTTEWMRVNYDKFNKSLFGGQLPMVRFAINNRLTRAWGRARGSISWRNGTVTPVLIEMTDKRDMPENAQESILVHEMIHILDYCTNPQHYVTKKYTYRGLTYVAVRGYDSHGSWFQSECNRINAMNLGFTVHTKVAEWQSNEMQWSEKEQEKINKKNSEGAIIGYIRKIGKTAVKPWFKIKTNKLGMRKYIQETTTYECYRDWSAYVDWYRSFDENDMRLKNQTSRGWWTASDEKDKQIREHQMEFIEKTVINPDFEDTEDVKKMSDEEYLDWFDKALNAMYERIWSMVRYNGCNHTELTEPNSNLKIVMTVDRKADNINLNFNGVKSLNFKNSSFVVNKSKYAKIVYKYVKDNGLITENKMKDYRQIIRETIEEAINGEMVANDVEVRGIPGQRTFLKKVSDDESIIATE